MRSRSCSARISEIRRSQDRCYALWSASTLAQPLRCSRRATMPPSNRVSDSMDSLLPPGGGWGAALAIAIFSSSAAAFAPLRGDHPSSVVGRLCPPRQIAGGSQAAGLSQSSRGVRRSGWGIGSLRCEVKVSGSDQFLVAAGSLSITLLMINRCVHRARHPFSPLLSCVSDTDISCCISHSDLLHWSLLLHSPVWTCWEWPCLPSCCSQPLPGQTSRHASLMRSHQHPLASTGSLLKPTYTRVQTCTLT